MTADGIVDDGGGNDGSRGWSEPSFVNGDGCCFLGRDGAIVLGLVRSKREGFGRGQTHHFGTCGR